jgi:O-acetyl-ADP-ribose deacetylase (regulator of RNase III)
VHTAPGALTDRGVAGIIHAVVFGSLGSPTTLAVVRRAIPAVLRVAAEHRHRSLAIPPIGSGNGPGQLPPRLVAEAIVMEVVAYLRRSAPRLDRCLFVSRSEDDTRAFADAIALARQHAWGQPE